MSSTLSRCEYLLNEALEAHAFSAGALAVGSGDTVYVKRAVGAVSYEEGAAKVTPFTLFDMASLSKILGTTFCAFHMIQEGSLCLQDTLGELLPDVPDDKKSITIQHLMTHTSGLPSGFLLCRKCTEPGQALNAILHTPLAYATGTDVTYSCMGYIVLACVMEHLTGKGLDVLSEEWTFRPLGMNATGYRPTSVCLPDRNIAFTETMTLNGSCPPGVVHDENARFLNGVAGNAGVFSNLEDMIRFAAMLSRGGAPLVHTRLMQLACRNYTCGLGENRGLGFQLSGPNPTFFGDFFGNDGFGHTGFTGTSLAVDRPSGLYVVLLTNRVHPTRDNNALTRLRRQIHNAAVGEFL